MRLAGISVTVAVVAPEIAPIRLEGTLAVEYFQMIRSLLVGFAALCVLLGTCPEAISKVPPPDLGFRPGVLPDRWPAGAARCAGVPEFHVHRYNEYQPDEHVLELGRGQLIELNDALAEMRGSLVRKVMRDFTISP